MKAPIVAVCRHPVALGLGLAGIACREVADADEAAAAVASAGAGVVLIERPLYDALPRALLRQVRRNGLPILMPFPGPSLEAVAPPEEELLGILRQAIGYRVRLR